MTYSLGCYCMYLTIVLTKSAMALFCDLLNFFSDDEIVQVERQHLPRTKQTIDLKCDEHVFDSDTDCPSEDGELLENKAFPQQRFSPVMKLVNPPGVTYQRPKPIKIKPESAVNNDLAGRQLAAVGGEDKVISRPSSNGSNSFQPTGAVFKAHTPKTRPLPLVITKSDSFDSRTSSAKSDAAMLQETTERTLGQVHSQRSKSISSLQSANAPQQSVSRQTHVKTLHNITMTTRDKQIIQSNTQTPLGPPNGKGAMMSKITHKIARGSALKSSPPNQTSNTASVSFPQLSHMTTFAKPIAIASKPLAPASAPVTPTVKIPTMTLAPQAALLDTNSHTNATTIKGLSNTILVPAGNLSTSQYPGLSILKQAGSSSTAKTVSISSSSGPSNLQGSYITTIRNVAPAQQGQTSSSNVQPVNPVAQQAITPATLLPNFVLKTSLPSQSGTQTVQTLTCGQTPNVASIQTMSTLQAQQQATLQPQQIHQQAPPRTPTHVQYILPSFAISPGPNGKMVAQVPQGAIQLIPSQQVIQTPAQTQQHGKLQLVGSNALRLTATPPLTLGTVASGHVITTPRVSTPPQSSVQHTQTQVHTYIVLYVIPRPLISLAIFSFYYIFVFPKI